MSIAREAGVDRAAVYLWKERVLSALRSKVEFFPGLGSPLKFDFHGSPGRVRIETSVVVTGSGARSLNELAHYYFN